jgi:hypothetical protein
MHIHIVLLSRCRTEPEADMSGFLDSLDTYHHPSWSPISISSLASQLATTFLTDTRLCPVMTHQLNELDCILISTLILTIISLLRSWWCLVL